MINQQISIRKATLNDIQQIHSLVQTCYRTEKSWTNEYALVEGERISTVTLHSIIQSENSDILLVATLNGTESIVGCIQIEPFYAHPVDLPKDSVMFGLLCVHPDHQSKGLGSILLNHAQTFAKNELNLHKGILWVINYREDIQKWYRKMGYEWNGSDTKPFVDNQSAMRPGLHFQVFTKDL